MKYIKWQSDSPETSVIGLGCMRISKMSESAVIELIDAALESGINLFDHLVTGVAHYLHSLLSADS